MKKVRPYRELTGIAIEAMMDSARKDEYIDKKKVTHFPQKRNKATITLKDVREWGKKRHYKEDTGLAVNAMMESAIKDPYADVNPPFRF